jgi:hypothetical protein
MELFSVCRQMEFGVQAIFGPSDPILGAHIQSICEALDVPHLEARIDFEPLSKEFSINLHPSQEHMNKAFKDLMTFLNWTKVAIIYEEDYGQLVCFIQLKLNAKCHNLVAETCLILTKRLLIGR